MSVAFEVRLKKTTDWLIHYMSGEATEQELTKIPSEVVEELSSFLPPSNVTVYRGIHFSYRELAKMGTQWNQIKIIHASQVSSWTHSLNIAREFATSNYHPFGIIIEADICPSSILVDTSRIRQKFFIADQKEVIVFPGTYRIQIIEYQQPVLVTDQYLKLLKTILKEFPHLGDSYLTLYGDLPSHRGRIELEPDLVTLKITGRSAPVATFRSYQIQSQNGIKYLRLTPETILNFLKDYLQELITVMFLSNKFDSVSA